MKRLITILLLTFWIVCINAQIQNDTICRGDSLLFNGVYYKTSGTYGDTATGILNLYVVPTYLRNQQVNLCNGTSYKYKGITYTQSAVIYDTLHSIHGCDSIIKISLNFHPTYFKSWSASICSGDSYRFGMRKLTKAGTYRDSMKTRFGCDSVEEVILTVNNNFYEDTVDSICSGMTYFWHGKPYTAAGTYRLVFKTVTGCDSIYTLKLSIRQNVIKATYDTICNGDSYFFHGNYYNKTGVYDHIAKTIGACDSIYRLYLQVNNPVYINRSVQICDNDTLHWAGKHYNVPGVYYDTMPGRKGECDTFSVITLSVLPSVVTTVNQSICENKPFYYRGKLIDKAGVYTDTFVAVNGCDSIVRMVVNVNPAYEIHDTAYICEGDSNLFFNMILKNPGTYTSYQTTTKGCDSVFVRTLVVSKKDTTTINIHRCDHMPYNFFGMQITQPGTYNHTLTNRFGCDSTITLNFDTAPYLFEDKAHICEGETYTYHGETFSVQGTHYVRFQGKYDCDSTYKLILTVGRKYEFTTDTTICRVSPFFWRGRQYTRSGTYTDSFTTTLGCDSIYVLNLTLTAPKQHSVITTFCQGDSLYYNGRVIKRSVSIDDTLRSLSGCDSIVHRHFNMLPSFLNSDTIDLCIGSSYAWHGKTITQSGVYWDSLKTKSGCDSIFQMTVRGVHSQTIPIAATICKGEYYMLNGRKIYNAGRYYDTIRNTQGCADIFVLDLTVNPTYLQTDYITLCSDQGFWYKGIYIDRAGVYYDSLKSSLGCDSVFRIVVNRMANFFYSDTARIYQGATYNFRGKILSAGGTYYDSLKSIDGCDSIYQLVLTVTPQFHQVDDVTICDNDYYYWRGRKLNTPGIYYDSLKNFNNLDSVYELRLSVNPSYFFTIQNSVCYGNTIHFRGKHITKPGIYYDSLYTIHGCDSVYQLIFNWSNTYLYEDTAVICKGDYHHFRGRDLFNPGIYYDSLLTQNGCDSVYKLTLIVKNHFYSEISDTICAGDIYDFHGRKLTEPGIYYDSLTTQQGCDSVYKLTLAKYNRYIFTDIIEQCYGETWQYRGMTIDKPGVYYDSLISSEGCDSVYKLVYTWLASYNFYDTVNICTGTHYNWRGQDVYKAGHYFDSLTTYRGCDSIYHLYLNVVKVFHDVQTVHICSNEYYNFRGTVLNQSGTYFDSLKNSYGCDSIYELRLTILPEYLIPIYAEICEGHVYQYKGMTITQSGTYYDSMKTQLGCDSVIMLTVNVTSRHMFVDTVSMCAGSTYHWRGRDITAAGQYYDSLKTQNGCDSIHKLVLNVIHPTHKYEYVTICDNEYYTFHGQQITQSGVFYDSLKNSQGCDSLVTYFVTVHPTYLDEKYTTLCHGNSIYFRGKLITAPGTYYDTLKTIHGCDSVFKMTFSWDPTYMIVDTITHCDGTPYNFRGRVVTHSGIYYDSLLTVAGCDSIYKLIFRVGNNYYDEPPAIHLCTSDVYYHHGQRITKSGIYWDSLTTTMGCDSVIKYTIVMDSDKFTPIHATICSNEIYYRPDGKTATATGVYLDTLVTTSGCDSIVQLALNVYPATLDQKTDTICHGNTYTWRGRVLTKAGVYWDSLTSIHGCDSIYKLRLYNFSYYTEIDTTLCDNTVFRFNDKIYTTSGIYYDTLKTVTLCDSVFKIDLTINPTYNIVRHITMCDTDFPIPFAGGFVNQTGVYHDTTTTLLGCDSINTLYLTVVPTFVLTEDTMCEDEIYSWRGHQYTQPGLYHDTIRDQTEAHCDIIYALRLHTVQKTNLYSADIAPYICADDIEYSIAPRYTGTKPDAYTIRYTSANIAKSSDIVNANFTSNPILVPLPLSVDGDSLRPDSYTGTLELYNRVCDANPMSIDFTLNIRYPSYIVEQHWNDVVAILNSNYNGGYTFSKYEWYVNEILIQSITGSNMFLPNLRTGDKIEVALTREGEGYSVKTCPIWMQDLSHMEVSDYPVAIGGTILRNNTQARIIASAAGIYSLYTATGALVTTGTFPADSETLVSLPPVAGIYFLKVVSNDEPRTFKLLVQ